MHVLTDQESATQADSRRTGQPSSDGFALTTDDIEILRAVYVHRFLDRNQLALLLGRHAKRLHRRVFKLERNGYLTSARFPQMMYFYGLGKLGVSTLVGEGIAPTELLDERLRTHELTELFLRHEKMIVDVHVALTLSKGAVRLANWREGRSLFDSVTAVDNRETDRLPIRPDAFFTLEDSRRPEGANRAHFALEADRSTTSQTRFEEKLRAYWNYIEQGLHVKKFGVKGFRIVTITLTDERAKNLCLLASTLPERARKYFLFASQKSFLQEADPISSSICYSPRDSDHVERHPLVPTPKPLQNNFQVV